MKTFTPPEFEEFLGDIAAGAIYKAEWWGDGWSTRQRPSDDDLHNRFLADKVAEVFSEGDGQTLLEVTGWSILQSYDNRKIFLGYRRLLGESRPLIEARAHLFAAHEIEDVRNLFNLGLMFLYDIKLMNLKTGIRVSISHHDGFDFRLSSAWQTAFENFFDGETVYWPIASDSGPVLASV